MLPACIFPTGVPLRQYSRIAADDRLLRLWHGGCSNADADCAGRIGPTVERNMI
jgi:hypothetical protein